MKSLALALLLSLPIALHGQSIFTGDGDWSDEALWDAGVPADNALAIVNGNAVITGDIATQNALNPGRIEIGNGAVGSLTVEGGTLSGAHGGGAGVFVGVGAGGDGTLIIDDGAVFRSQGGNMNLRIGDADGGVGRVVVSGEFQNYKFFELVNGTLEMMPTGVNSKFNEANPSLIGANGTLSYVIDGDQVGALRRSNNSGLHLTVDPQATLKITLGGQFSVGDSWTLMSYTNLSGQFAQGTSFVNAQGYAFEVDYGSGSGSEVILTLASLDARPKIESFTADPVLIAMGDSTDLNWAVDKFSSITIDQGVGDVSAMTTNNAGSMTVSPTETTTYLLTVDFNGILATQALTVVVDSVPLVQSFTASPELVAPGGEVTLRWNVAGADTVILDPGVGAVESLGEAIVTPNETTSYKLTVTNANGTTSRDISVTVNALEAAIVHSYDAGAENQTDGALKDSIGSSNWDVKNGELAEVTSERTTITKAHRMLEFTDQTGSDNGDRFPSGDTTYELWARTGDFADDVEHQVIFETGSGGNGTSILVSQDSIRLLHSQGGTRTLDLEASLLQVNVDGDYLQIVASLDLANGMATLFVRGAGGGQASIMGAGTLGAPDGRASLFSHSNFAAGIANSLGGSGGEAPEGTTQFRGEIAVLKVYDRALGTVEVDQAFKKLAVDGEDDADNDGLLDFWEVRFFGNTNATANQDTDNDGLTNRGEFEAGARPDTPDSDDDGLTDGEEVNTYGSNPIALDSDGDGLSDGREVNELGTDPAKADTDDDGFRDDVELALATDPTNADNSPPANAILLTRAPAGVEDWNSPDIWADGLAPSADKDYVIVGSLAPSLRTPNDSNPTFNGGSLILAGEGILDIRHTGTAMISQLTVRDRATIAVNSASATIGGKLALDGHLTFDQRTEGAVFNLGSQMTGAGSVELFADTTTLDVTTLRLTGVGSDYQANWIVNGSTLNAISIGSLGTGNVTLRQGGFSASYNLNLPANELLFVGGDFVLGLEKELVFKSVRAVSPEDESAELLSLPGGDYDVDRLVNDVQFGDDQVIGSGVLAIIGDTGDTDNDGLLDRWEREVIGDLSQSADGDADEDGLTVAQEFAASSDPTKADSDEDGLNDGLEVTTVGSDPNKADTDEDGLSDRDEVEGTFPSSPLLVDTDNDGRSDFEEISGNPTSDPGKADTDGDGFSDGFEVAQGSNPSDANEVPADQLGTPTQSWTTLEALPSFHDISEGGDLRNAAFRVWIDFEPKLDGERELIFETGGSTIGHSVVYEAPNKLVYRANGNGGLSLSVIEHTLTQDQLDAGQIEIVWSYDVLNDEGTQTIALFLDGVSVGAISQDLGGDWSGTDAAAFGVASQAVAGDGANNNLAAIDFGSGSINEALGLEFFTDRLYVGSGGGPVDPTPSTLQITEVTRTADGIRLAWSQPAQGTIAVQYSSDLQAAAWETIINGAANGTAEDTDATRASAGAGFYRLLVNP